MDLINSITVPELLAPAGSLAHLKAAIHAGADAVYMGGQRFGARAYAENFSEDELVEGLHYAHFYNKRLYQTVNTLMKDEELECLYEFLLPYYEAGLDGVIVQDLGTAAFIQNAFPKMEIHASTQMTITDVAGAMAAKRFGMTRVVPARELSFEEIRRIKEETGLEVEIFAHGALCYCYSGQCLLSSTYGGRSGNRGRCAQPCRLSYQLLEESGKKVTGKKHLLSPKDLCAYPLLQRMCEYGFDSLKIEGRMKNVEYVAGVTEIYRKELDRITQELGKNAGEDFKKDSKPYHDLEELYCREGFTDGYFEQHNGSGMMAVNYPKNLGRKIGKIVDVKKFQITIALWDELEGLDVLVIPTDSQNEIVLTVPAEGAKGNKITLRLPKGSRVDRGMEVYRRRSEKLIAHINSDLVAQELKLDVNCRAEFHLGKPAKVNLCCEDQEVCLSGHTVEAAQKRSLSKDDILKQFRKTGGVPFRLSHCEIILDDGCFLPLSALKELRQRAYALLQEKLERRYDRTDTRDTASTLEAEETAGEVETLSVVKEEETSGEGESLSVLKAEETAGEGETSVGFELDDARLIATVYSENQLKTALSQNFFEGYTFPAEFWSETELRSVVSQLRSDYPKLKLYYNMPRVYRDERRRAAFNQEVENLCKSGIFDAIYAYNINESELVREIWHLDVPMIFAASLYEWNQESIQTYDKLYGDHVCELPRELSVEEWGKLMDRCPGHQFEALVYGHYPVMLSAQCLKATTGRCDHKPGLFYLKDQKGRNLPVSTCCKGCYNVIWKDNPWNLMEESVDVPIATGKLRQRFDLFQLDEKQIITVIKMYKNYL